MHIKVENLEKSYTVEAGVEVRALQQVNFEIQSGETVAVMGPSGAGKSTLLHLLGLMDSPTKGKVFLGGAELAGAGEKDRAAMRRDKIGFLFQMHYLLPEFTVLENLLIPVWDNRREKEPAAMALLAKLGLKDRMRHLPSQLSGGEQQRVALARALINDPALLLADEPTGNLDRKTGQAVEGIIFSECKDRKITLVVVTHNPELAGNAARIIQMCDGTIIS